MSVWRGQSPGHAVARAIVAAGCLLCTACGPGVQPEQETQAAARADAGGAALLPHLARIRAAADSVDEVLLPLPLLRPGQEEELRRHLNPAQLAEARRHGIDPSASSDALAALEQSGRVVRLPDSTDYWVVRRLDHSEPLLTPPAREVLDEIGRRFQQRLAGLGLPRYRMEVTSVLRTAAQQAELRRTNPNAAGETTHSYATTFDIAYSAFAPPVQPLLAPPRGLDAEGDTLFLHLAAVHAERIAARRSRELMAVLGEVLIGMQREGSVMVTLERLQPVYHITVRRPA